MEKVEWELNKKVLSQCAKDGLLHHREKHTFQLATLTDLVNTTGFFCFLHPAVHSLVKIRLI